MSAKKKKIEFPEDAEDVVAVKRKSDGVICTLPLRVWQRAKHAENLYEKLTESEIKKHFILVSDESEPEKPEKEAKEKPKSEKTKKQSSEKKEDDKK